MDKLGVTDEEAVNTHANISDDVLAASGSLLVQQFGNLGDSRMSIIKVPIMVEEMYAPPSIDSPYATR